MVICSADDNIMNKKANLLNVFGNIQYYLHKLCWRHRGLFMVVMKNVIVRRDLPMTYAML